MHPAIELIMFLCDLSGCTQIRFATQFHTTTECEVRTQQAFPQIMANVQLQFPTMTIGAYSCVLAGEDT